MDADLTDFADFTADGGGENIQERRDDAATRRDQALAIKACLESLRADARAFSLRDLDRFLELAVMAADEAVAELAAVGSRDGLRYARPLGEC
ncbi:MAG TPA: hypothetical protein PKZ97_01575 [Azospirillaceae bacterium]|nr:hypothetical protein [Azospirillaceae bacterium]HRQ79785.1 hypothetical protein [Azospirillaceae bacterium]